MSKANLYSLLAPLSPTVGGLIWADQNGPRPEKPYATVAVRSFDPFPVVKQTVDVDGIENVSQLVRLAVEWQFIGLNALDMAKAAQLKLRTDTQANRAEVLNLGVSAVNSGTAVPTVLNTTQIEERAIVELIVYDSEFVLDDVGLIENVEISGTADDKLFCVGTVSKGA